jgi:acetyl-CoA carboxylase carboxyltransferase component
MREKARAVSAPVTVLPPETMHDRVIELEVMRQNVRRGDAEATAQQRATGKLTVRERLDVLLDDNSFEEVESFRRHRASEFGLAARRPYGDGVVAGWGRVHGREVMVYAHDGRVFGGALGEAHAQKIHKVMDLAYAAGVPLVSLDDGAGARIQEGVTALAGYGGIVRRNVRASGVIPQISVMMGPGAVFSPALTDVVFMVARAERSGAADFVHPDEPSCLTAVRRLLSLLPPSHREPPPLLAGTDPLDRGNDVLLDLVPADTRQAYDMLGVIREIVDDGNFLEFSAGRARNLVCGLATMGGRVVGVVANQPMRLGGALDGKASEKAARFIRMCDAFNIALVTLVDVPGFLPGPEPEHGARMLYAYCAATVPRVQVVLRKAYGGAYLVMDSRSIGCDVSYAWPTNEIAVIGAEAAADVVFGRDIAAAADPAGRRATRAEEIRRTLMHPFHAAERGLVDDVIDPRQTRAKVIRALDLLRAKHRAVPAREHGNPPL